MAIPYASPTHPWLMPVCRSRLSLRIPDALMVDLEQLAAEAGSNPATTARVLLAQAVKAQLSPA